MVAKKMKQHLKEEKGFATIEALTMLFILVSIMSFAIGSFGVVHTGVLNSISSRAYVWEMMEQRADVSYHRSNPGYAGWNGNMRLDPGFRYGSVSSEHMSGEPRFMGTARNVDFREKGSSNNSQSSDHNRIQTLNLSERASIGVDSVWVKTMYGICLTASCGGVQ